MKVLFSDKFIVLYLFVFLGPFAYYQFGGYNYFFGDDPKERWPEYDVVEITEDDYRGYCESIGTKLDEGYRKSPIRQSKLCLKTKDIEPQHGAILKACEWKEKQSGGSRYVMVSISPQGLIGRFIERPRYCLYSDTPGGVKRKPRKTSSTR